MGLGRFIKRQIPLLHTIDTVKNMVEEKSVVEGAKRTFKEDVYEDNPVTSTIYNAGKYEGKKEGYAEASEVYEQKLLEQADEFIKQQKIAEEQFKQYEELLNEYESAIDELSDKLDRTDEENELLRQLLLKERQLKKLKVG